MKKSVKILTLVLSLALLCGALVVAAFAEGETTEIVGVRLDNSADMEDPYLTELPTVESKGTIAADGLSISGTINQLSTNLDKDSGSAKAVQFKHQMGNTAIGKVVTSVYDENSYFTVETSDKMLPYYYNSTLKTASSGHMLNSYTSMSGWDYIADPETRMRKSGNNEVGAGEYWGIDTQYFVMDVDLMWFDPANYDGTGFFYPYLGWTNAAGNSFTAAANGQFGIRFTKSGSAVVAGLQNGNTTVSVGSDGTWSHVTYIMGFGTKVDDDGTNVVLKQYLAVDGVIVDYVEWASTVAVTDVLNGDRTLIYSRDIRLDIFGRVSTTKVYSSGAADNYVIRTLTKDYNGNLATVLADGVGADLTKWESNLYDADNMPFGTPIATIGDTYYDSFNKALAAAASGDTIVLQANVTTHVVLDKLVTIECGDYTIADITAGQGYRYDYDADTKTYTTEATQGEFYLFWEACECGLGDVCDETHPGGIDTVGWEGGTIGASYTKDLNWSCTVGATVYSLAGWVDDNGDPVDLNTVITAEMCDDLTEMTLYPVIATESATLTYVKGGELIYLTGDTAVKTALLGADPNTTITLYDTAKHYETVTIPNSLTLDLNGQTLSLLCPVKQTSFTLSTGKTFTVLGEKEGSTLVHGFPKSEYTETASNVAGGTLFSGGGAGTVLNFKGAGLRVATGALYGSWAGHAMTINIEDCYINTDNGQENPATIYHYGPITVNIKNATFGGATIGINYNVAEVGTNKVINVENSVILGSFISSSFPKVSVNLKNSYVAGSISAAEINVGDGCYFTNNSWVDNATFDEGIALVAETYTAQHNVYDHKFFNYKDGDDLVWDHEVSLTYTPSVSEVTYAYQSCKVVNVTFKDGETTLGTAAGKAGAKVIGPTTGTTEAVADGWILATKSYAYTIPEDATADIVVDIANVTEYGYAYAAGTPKLYANYRLTDNLETSLYVPAELPEGIEITEIAKDGTSGRTLSGNYTIGGVAYTATHAWPNAWSADEGTYWDITYSYDGTNVTYRVTVDVVNYATKVVDIYATDLEKIQQVTALLQYVEAANKIKAVTISNGLSETLAALKEKVTIPAVTTEYLSDLSQLRQYISGVAVSVNSSRGGSMLITPVDATNTVNIIVGEKALQTEVKDGVVMLTNTSLCNWAAKDLTIQVLDADGAVLATGTYSLAAYYNEMASMATADQLALLEAMYALAAIGNTNN